MKHRILCILFLIMILSSCSYNNTKSTVPKPNPHLTQTTTVRLPKLTVNPDTGFYLDCIHIAQNFSLANDGDLPLTWISTLLPTNGGVSISGVTVKPASGVIPAGATIMVAMQGKVSTPFILRFIYKQSDKHFFGISQEVSCKS